MQKTYAIYVSNPNGWQDNPTGDWNETFFNCGKPYVHPKDGGIKPVGHIVVEGNTEAQRVLDKLNTTGDWIADDTGKEVRPVYAIREI